MSFGLRRTFDRSARPARRVPLLRAVAVRPLVAAALAGVMALNLGGSGVEGLSPLPSGHRGEDRRAVAAGARPQQDWGAGGGRTHVVKGPVNRELPMTERGRYPLHRLAQEAKPPRNEARVAKPPAGSATGFDRKTSRERPAERGAHRRVYDNADGSQTTELSAAPVNYRRPDGSWAPIDGGLVPAPDGSGWQNAADATRVWLAGRSDADDLVRLTFDGGAEFGYTLADAAAVTGQAADDAVTYPGVQPEVDLRLEPRPGGVKETLVLHSAAAPTSYLFPLRLRELTAKLVDGQVVLTDRAGTQRAVIPPGYMVDAGDDTRAPVTSTGVHYELVDTGGQPALRVTIDRAWLADPTRRYPVEVDPTVGPPVTGIGGGSSMYVHGSSSASGSEALLVGRAKNASGNEANAAAYVKFDTAGLSNHTIHGVALSVVNYEAASCKPRPVTVHPVTEAWSAGGGYSFPGPSVGGSLASRSFAHGYIAFGQSQSACPLASEMFDLGVAGRNLVQRWVNGQQANNGLSLRASTTDSTAWKRFAGTGTANPPKLYVTHSPYNAGYAIPKPTPEPPVLRNQDGKVKVTVTNLGAENWTPANYYLAYRVYNARTGAAVTQQRAANLPATLARGAKVTLDATVKQLEPGAYFLDFTMVRTGGVVFTDHQVPPGRIVLQVFDVPPVVQELYPNNGYRAPTLTPLLWARAVDTDAPPGATLSFKFEVCDAPTPAPPPTAPTPATSTGPPGWFRPGACPGEVLPVAGVRQGHRERGPVAGLGAAHLGAPTRPAVAHRGGATGGARSGVRRAGGQLHHLGHRRRRGDGGTGVEPAAHLQQPRPAYLRRVRRRLVQPVRHEADAGQRRLRQRGDPLPGRAGGAVRPQPRRDVRGAVGPGRPADRERHRLAAARPLRHDL